MKVFDPLQSSFINRKTVEDPQLTDQSLCTTEFSVFKLLASLNSNKASGPDHIPAWILKENADILASTVSDILNLSYKEALLPSIRKHADIIPIPNEKPVQEVNKLQPNSLTPIMSKIAEDFIVEDFVKPAVLQRIDPKARRTRAHLSRVLVIP
jgi:hypothetical protein